MRRIVMAVVVAGATIAAALGAVAPAGASTVPAAVGSPGVGAAAPDAAACGRNGPLIDKSAHTATTASQLRNGSSTGCPAIGTVQAGQRVQYYCWTNGTGSPAGTWTFVRNLSTNRIGWVYDAYLPGHGSNSYCGF